MDQPIREHEEKVEREGRLRWQSRFLLVLVLPISAAGLSSLASQRPTPATVEGLALCAAFGLLVWLLRAATPLAAMTGFLLTSCMYLGTTRQPHGGWFHTALVPGLALFVLAFVATRFRRRQKEQRGLAESRKGRGAAQVTANMGAAALAALALEPGSLPLLHLFAHGYTPTGPILFAPLVAALAEAAADTVSSEVGQALGGSPFMIIGLKRVNPGTDGALSAAGTAAGLIAAAMVVLVAVPALGLETRQAGTAWTAAVLGLFVDSLLGATLERGGWLNNDAVNFLSTALAAGTALAAPTWLHW